MPQHRILIVDDQVDVRRMLRAGLETLGPEVTVLDIPSAEEALLEISRNPVDLIILDVRLPGMSGLELLEKLKKQKPKLKVILITGLTDPRSQELFQAADVVGRFNKPVPMGALLETVQKNLEQVPVPPISAEASPVAASGFSSPDAALIELHRALNATDVILVDYQGNILSRTGNLPESLISSLIPAAFSNANESRRIFHLLGTGSVQHTQVYEGADFYLVTSQVRETHLLMAFLQDFQGEDSYLAIRSAIHDYVENLALIGMDMPIPSMPPGDLPTQQSQVDQRVDEEMQAEVVETIFSEEVSPSMAKDDLDDYWSKAVNESDPNATSNKSALSFDQARKLGFAPNDDTPG